ncbi:MAG: hypothetical protein ABW139_08080 [Candidatus Thiodiazotropha sp. DIVDIV]
MSHKLRTNLILLITIGLLAVVVWWSQPAPIIPLSQLLPHQITRITISGPSRESINMTLSGDQWLVEDRPGLSSRIKQLLEICQTPSLNHFPAPAELNQFGLDRPDLVLQLNQEQFLFGITDPINGWRYILHRGEVHLIGNGFQHHLIAPIEAWQENPDA